MCIICVVLRMLPWDVIRLIVSFSGLSERYTFSQCCREFRSIDWGLFGSLYKLDPCSRSCLRDLVEGNYSKDWDVCLTKGMLWNCHMSRPLRVWTPWTTKWHDVSPNVLLIFSKWQFVDYVIDLGCKMEVRTPCIRRNRSSERVVRVFLFQSARVKAYVVTDNERQCRRKWHYSLMKKRTRKVRALVGFRVGSDDSLRVDVKCLEFAE